MGFKAIDNLKISYETNKDNVILDFYIPVLKNAKKYYRTTGYFSSNILLEITNGLSSFIKNNGHMRLIVAPTISKEDYEAIKSGYELRDLLTDKIVNSFDEFVEYDQREDRFGLLSYLIRNNFLEIKIVALEENNDKAMYHEKIGIIYDDDENVIAFTGSANETYNAYVSNFESIDVFYSWKPGDSFQRCLNKEERFEKLWNGMVSGLVTIDFPDAIKNKLLKYENGNSFMKVDENFIDKFLKKRKNNFLSFDDLREYQKEAILKWESNSYKGIFDMATGTGKTFTAIGAILRLRDKVKRTIVFVCCPYIHLVEQWYEELQKFGINSIVCYGGKNYEEKLDREVYKFKRGKIDFLCALFTNLTFNADKNKKNILSCLKDTLLVVDEAHNFGAPKISKMLENDFKYRLALSATIDRYGDEEGTSKIYDFFGKKCIEYDLERAIKENFLTPYYYYPVIVSLTEDELEEYRELSKSISKYFNKNKNNEHYKMLLIKRARIISGAFNKVDKLIEILARESNKTNILIYCGAVKYSKVSIDDVSEEDVKQLKIIVQALLKLGIKVSTFTSNESVEERMNIIENFKNKNIQAIAAIKCLDEGVNIPSIETAYILASSTNPKEYIQRRGRVLRKAPNKVYSYIYDFITLPRSISAAETCSYETLKIGRGLIKREFERLEEFSRLAVNKSEIINIKDNIRKTFMLDKIFCDDEGDNYESE